MIVACVNAAGEHMPPLVVHRGTRVQESWSKNAPPRAVVKATSKGYVNEEVFYLWGQMFLHHLEKLGLINDNNVLTFDGHGSHVYNLPLMQDFQKNNISAVTFEPHTTHVTQPIDQHPLAIFKKYFHYCLTVWSQKHRGKPLPKSEFFKVFLPAWNKGMSEKYIKAGFHITGLWPLNPDAIPDDKFTGDVLYSDTDTDTDSDSDVDVGVDKLACKF